MTIEKCPKYNRRVAVNKLSCPHFKTSFCPMDSFYFLETVRNNRMKWQKKGGKGLKFNLESKKVKKNLYRKVKFLSYVLDNIVLFFLGV